MSAVAIIPARGGSRRIPRKNIRDFHGKPIIAYSIDAARDSGLFDLIIVSTDDDEIASVAIDCGAEVMMRSAEMSRDEVGTQEVMRDVLGRLSEIEYACCIYPCSPLLLSSDLIRGRAALEHDYAMSVLEGTHEDAGNFYWGEALSFTNEVPLGGSLTALVELPADRVCDINTMDDWLRAESMFLKLRG